MSNEPDRCWSRIGVAGDATCERLASAGHCRNCEEYSHAGRGLLDREAPELLRQEWSSVLAEPRTAAEARGDSVLVFQVRREYLAVPAILLDLVAEMRPVHRVPGRASAVFIGVVNIDGELLPCFSVAAALQLGEPAPAATSGRIIVLHQAGIRLACSVDQVVGVVRLSGTDLEAPPVTLAHYARALTTAVFAVKGKRAGLLDGDKFLQRLIASTAR